MGISLWESGGENSKGTQGKREEPSHGLGISFPVRIFSWVPSLWIGHGFTQIGKMNES